MDWFRFTIFAIGYLEKEARRVRETLKQRTRKFFWAILIFKQAV
jgi:hypothetical protein